MRKQTVEIHVTQEHIDKAGFIYIPSEHCPLELALIDAGFKNPLVGCQEWALDSSDEKTWPLPREAVDFVTNFDMNKGNKGVEPATFILAYRS